MFWCNPHNIYENIIFNFDVQAFLIWLEQPRWQGIQLIMMAFSASTDCIAPNSVIDWQHPLILAKATQLAEGEVDEVVIARRCFEFVRDDIKHSWDYRLNPVTCMASDVLRYGTGYCYAKSHLLAALLRANQIPAGLCYQRLSLDEDVNSFCLHGLNAVYLKQYGWYRIDARGNKPGIEAAFCPPLEQLAFTIAKPGEGDLPGIYDRPLAVVRHVLAHYTTIEQVFAHLPDRSIYDDDEFNSPSGY